LAFYHDLISKEAPDNKAAKLKQLPKTEIPDRTNPRTTKGGKAGKGSTYNDRYQPYVKGRWNDSSGWRPSSWNTRSYQANSWNRDGQQASSGRTDTTNRDSPGLRGTLSTLGYPTYGIGPCKDAQLCFVAISAFCFPFSQVWK